MGSSISVLLEATHHSSTARMDTTERESDSNAPSNTVQITGPRCSRLFISHRDRSNEVPTFPLPYFRHFAHFGFENVTALGHWHLPNQRRRGHMKSWVAFAMQNWQLFQVWQIATKHCDSVR